MFAGNVYRHNIKGTWANVSATRYAAYKRSGCKCLPRHLNGEAFYFEETIVIERHFYFVKDEFYNALPNCCLMANKGGGAEKGGRPCHYCFKYNDYYWLVPISSQVEKYKKIYNNKIAKRGICDTIRFGFVNGEERAFLIQNCFPITEDYIDKEYMIQNGTVSVSVSSELSEELDKLMHKVIKLYYKGRTLPLTKIAEIIEFLKR